MENTFLNGNHLIKERISAFRAEPTADSFGAVFEQVMERMAEVGTALAQMVNRTRCTVGDL